MCRFHVIIPARYGSQRLPGKPLLQIGDKPMIQHVVESALRSSASSVTVATDDSRIQEAVQKFGGSVVMTSPNHSCGTDRIAEAINKLSLTDTDIIVNVQGDEPHLQPALINQVAALLIAKPLAVMATLAVPLDNLAQLTDPAVVKVILGRDSYALYFSRAAIPWAQDGISESANHIAQRHLGIYAYSGGYLRRFSKLSACKLEQYEKLEQLRVLWYGEKIACATAVATPPPGIDTAADLERVRRTSESQQ